MTNVSKQPLSREKRNQLFRQFSGVFIAAGEQKMASVFMELFTESEQLMFIKRVGIIFMLHKGFSNYEVASSLLVSKSTVQSINKRYEEGEYQNIVGVMKRRSFDPEAFWEVLETVLRAGLPPRGRGRWSSVIKSMKR